MSTRSLRLRVNGVEHDVEVDPETPLVYVLRDALALTGTKLGCGLEQCGTCTVLVDGEPTLSCVRAVSEFQGREIVTIEGLRDSEIGVAILRAFVAHRATQCGYCTPGIVVATVALLASNPRPNEAEVRDALAQHLCRCGSHARVLAAIRSLIAPGAADAS